MKKLTMAAVAVFALGGASGLVAQPVTTTMNGEATITIPEVLMMVSVSNLEIAFNADHFANGVTASREGEVTVATRGNVLHRINVTRTGLDGFNLSLLPGGDPAPVDESTPVVAATGLARGNQSTTLNFRATADLAQHAAGTYSGTITYTVVAEN